MQTYGKICRKFKFTQTYPPPGSTDLERGYGDVRPWRPPFHASPVVCKGPISSKRVSSQDPLLRKFGNVSLYSLNFHPDFSSQAPKFGHFQFTSPLFRGKYQFASPTLRESGPHTPTLKKSWVPPAPPPFVYLVLPTIIFKDICKEVSVIYDGSHSCTKNAVVSSDATNYGNHLFIDLWIYIVLSQMKPMTSV